MVLLDLFLSSILFAGFACCHHYFSGNVLFLGKEYPDFLFLGLIFGGSSSSSAPAVCVCARGMLLFLPLPIKENKYNLIPTLLLLLPQPILCFFSSPSSQTRVPGHFLHPLAFFPAPWSHQFLHLVLGLQSPLTACARHAPTLCSIFDLCGLCSWRQSASPRNGCFSTVAVEYREASLWTETEQQLYVPNCLYRSAYPIDRIGLSIVRWEPLCLSSTDVLLLNGMQITVWEPVPLHYRCRKLLPAITSSFFSSLWGAPYGG